MNNSSQCGCRCGSCGSEEAKKTDKKILVIAWQRLVSEGGTCPRCETTENELDKAVSQLKKSLSPLGIDVTLEKIELTLEEFKKNPAGSNRIFF
jgi:hypothetical protein